MLPLPWLAGGLAIYFGARLLSRRRNGSVVRLRDGRRVTLVSAVALVDRSADDLLALEYLSALPGGNKEMLRLEAAGLVRIVGARAAYTACRRAVVTTRPRRSLGQGAAPEEQVFTFRRADSGPDWYPTDTLD